MFNRYWCLPHRPGDLRSIPRTHIKERTDSIKLSSTLHTQVDRCSSLTPQFTHTVIIKSYIFKAKEERKEGRSGKERKEN